MLASMLASETHGLHRAVVGGARAHASPTHDAEMHSITQYDQNPRSHTVSIRYVPDPVPRRARRPAHARPTTRATARGPTPQACAPLPRPTLAARRLAAQT
jgi:hypothetical protein